MKDGKLTIAGYWEFDREEAREKYDFDRPEQTLRELLTDSVRLRLRSDVPVGTCLSGGLDSSTIVSIADRFFSTSINTFSSLYSEDGYDESRFVEIVNNLCKTTPHPVRPKPQGFMDIMKEISWYQDEPTAGPGVYSQWHVMKEAHGVVKVLLDGQGGDELLAGYFPYYHHYAASMWQDVKRRKSLGMLRRFIRENRKIREKYPQHNAIRAFLYPLAPKILRRVYRKLKSMRGPRLKEPDVLNSDFVAMVRKESPPERPRRDLGDPLNTVLHDSLTRSSIPALLHYEDRNSMAFSIEARTPFLDYRVVEFCLALPYDIKIHNGETKYVLRQAMCGVLPDEIVNRYDKMGYPTPMANWFRNEVYDDLRDVVLSRRCIERGIFSRDGLERLISSHKNGRKDANWELYRILATELWFERFIDKQG
ncbi:MAG: asparagine synthase C-terminal domain-containing protein [Planctomycetota bacterium]